MIKNCNRLQGLMSALFVTLVIFSVSQCWMTASAGQANQPKITLNAGHNNVAQYPHGVIIHRFAEKVNNGGLNINVQVFDNSAIGSEDQMFQGMMSGTVDMAKISVAQAGSIIPEFMAFELPYLLESRDQMFKVIDGPIGQKLEKELQDRAGVKILAWMDQGTRSFYTVNKPIKKPEDMRGLKIRTGNSPITVTTVNTLGAAATPLSFGDLYTALRQGVVDGAENAPDSIYYAKHNEVAKYFSLTEHFRMPVLFCISMVSYNKLTDEQKELVVNAAQTVAAEGMDLYQVEADRLLKEMIDRGLNVQDVDIEAFHEAVKPVYANTQNIVSKEFVEAIRNTK